MGVSAAADLTEGIRGMNTQERYEKDHRAEVFLMVTAADDYGLRSEMRTLALQLRQVRETVLTAQRQLIAINDSWGVTIGGDETDIALNEILAALRSDELMHHAMTLDSDERNEKEVA